MKLRIVTLLGVLVVSLLSVPSVFAQKFAVNGKMTPDIRSEFTFQNLSDGNQYNHMDGAGRLRWTLEGRIENKDTGFYVYSKVQPLVNVAGTLTFDDSYGQFGNKSFYLKLGRFEAELLNEKNEDLFTPRTSDLGIYKTPLPYRADNAWGRRAGDFALGFNASPSVLFELSGVYGNLKDTQTFYTLADMTAAATTASATVNEIGLRPAVRYTYTLNKTSSVIVKAGFDYLTYTPKDADAKGANTKVGFGGQVIGLFGGLKVSMGAGSFNETNDSWKDGTSFPDQRTTTVGGGFMYTTAAKHIIGLSGFYTTEDLYDSKDLYVYGAFEYRLPLESVAYVKLAPGFATGTDIYGTDVKTYGARVRFDYYL